MKVKAALLSLLMLLSLLLGCGSAKASDASTTVPQATVTAEPVPTDAPTPEPTAEPTAEPTEEPTPEPTAEPAPAYTLEDYSGLYIAGVYINLPFDLAFVIPEDWGTEYEAALQGDEFYAISSDGNMVAVIECMDAGQTITEEYMDALMAQVKESWAKQLEEMDAVASTLEITSMEIAGRTVPALHFEAEQDGDPLYFVNGYLSTDNYLLSVIVMTNEADPFAIASSMVKVPEEARALLTLVSTTDADTDSPEGYYVGTQYVNPYFGLTVDLPEGWEFYDEAALAEQNGMDVSSMVGDNWEELIRNSTSIILMGAQTADGLQSMNFALTAVENAATVYTENMQKLALETSMDPLTNVYTSMGYSIDFMEMDTVEVMGEVIPCLCVELSVNGIYLSEVLFILSGADYIFNVTFVSVGGNAFDLVPMLNPLA